MDPITVGSLAVWVHGPAEPKGRILLIHGLSEHSGRHHHTYEYLAGQGWEVVRFDLRGAGRSGGRRQYIDRFEEYVEDAAAAYNWALSTRDSLPVFVLGHSLGGAIAIHFAAHYGCEIQGLALSAPAYLPGDGFPPWKIQIGRLLSGVLPTLPMPGSTRLWVSRDPEAIRAYEMDPLACKFNTLRQGICILNALERIPELCERIECPTFIAHGSLDRLVRLEGSFEILQSLAAPDRTLHVIPGGYHEPHNDWGKEDYFAALGAWLDSHLPR